MRAKTCDAGMTAKPSFKKIENVLLKTIVPDSQKLKVTHIRYIEPEEGEQKVWVSIDETPDKDMENVACVYYSDSVNGKKFEKIYTGNEKGQTGSLPSADDAVSGYIDLEAGPFDFSDEIFFPHYRFKWHYDTADLEIATDKMRPNTSRSEKEGFGPDRARICFKVKERAKVVSCGYARILSFMPKLATIESCYSVMRANLSAYLCRSPNLNAFSRRMSSCGYIAVLSSAFRVWR